MLTCRARRLREKTPVMTLVFREAPPNHKTRCKEENVFLAMLKDKQRVLYHQRVRNSKTYHLPLVLFICVHYQGSVRQSNIGKTVVGLTRCYTVYSIFCNRILQIIVPGLMRVWSLNLSLLYHLFKQVNFTQRFTHNVLPGTCFSVEMKGFN